MAIEVRLLGAADGDVLSRVADDVFDDAIDVEAARTFLADPRHVMAVALDAGLVVGFASAVAYVHPDKPRPELWINEVGVAATHHRRGLGRRLMSAVLDRGRERGCSEAWVLADQSNETARAFYRDVGGDEREEPAIMYTFTLGNGDE